MEETRPDSTPISERKKPKITTPFIATLIGCADYGNRTVLAIYDCCRRYG